MCAPVVAGVQAASGLASSIGGFMSQSAATDAYNDSVRKQYEYQMAQRELDWRSTLDNYSLRKVQYEQGINDSNAAASRGYMQEQQRLNEIYQQAAFQSQGMVTKALEGQGLAAASGSTGKSAQRIDNAIAAAAGRNMATTKASLDSAQNAYKLNTESIRDQLKSYQNQAYSSVALKPTPGFTPPAPQLKQGPDVFGLIGGIGSSLVSGYQTFSGLSANDVANLPSNNAALDPFSTNLNLDYSSLMLPSNTYTFK